MNWKNRKEVASELYLILGMVIIIVGVIHLMDMGPWHIIIGGFIVMQIGVVRILKELKKKGIKRR